MPIETEVKIRLKDQDPGNARRMIEAAGYKLAGARTLESDQLYDQPDAPLRRSGKLLRLRSSGRRFFLTYKGPAASGRHKSREEIEIEIADGPALAAILSGLGFIPGWRYEKYRTTFAAEGEPGLVILDETPMGLFLELEGPPDWIDTAAVRLGFTPSAYITSSYGSLFREFRRANPGVPEDMTF
jgi:adenylate cyclase class 2